MFSVSERTRRQNQQAVIVLDTGILYAAAQPFELPELKELGEVEYVVPAAVLWELDQLMQRIETRDRTRAALNVLARFVARGAAIGPVSCGDGCTLRVGRVDEVTYESHLSAELADDRILATCLKLAEEDVKVTLATTEFALYAKALSARIDSLYLDRYADTLTRVTRREQVSFRTAWSRIESADTSWAFCRRALSFLTLPLAMRLLDPVRKSGQPGVVAAYLAQFDRLSDRWGEDVNLFSIMQEVLRVAPPSNPDYSVRVLREPGLPWAFGRSWQDQQITSRRESDEERALRIRAEERLYRGRDDYVRDMLLGRLEVIRDYMLDQVGEDLL